MSFSEPEYLAICGLIVIGCFLALAIVGVFSNVDLEGGKSQMLEQRAIKFGSYIIASKGIRDNYEISNVSCPGGTWFWLEYEYEVIRISMQVIYWEHSNSFTLKEDSFSQIPI